MRGVAELASLKLAADTAKAHSLPAREPGDCSEFAAKLQPLFVDALEAGLPAKLVLGFAFEHDDAGDILEVLSGFGPIPEATLREGVRGVMVVADIVLTRAKRTSMMTEIRLQRRLIMAALRIAVDTGVPLDVALDLFGRSNVSMMAAVLGTELINLRCAGAEVIGGSPAILLPEHVDAHGQSAIPLPPRDDDASDTEAAEEDVCVQPASEAPRALRSRGSRRLSSNWTLLDSSGNCSTCIPDASVSKEDVRHIDEAVAIHGLKLDDEDRLLAARMFGQLRDRLVRRSVQTARPRLSLAPARIPRQTRASRAPRRAAHRSGIAPARDGPPPPAEPPAPAAKRSQRVSVGGAR